MTQKTCDRCGEKIHPDTDAEFGITLGTTTAIGDLCDACQLFVRSDLVRYMEGSPVSQGPWLGEVSWE